MIITACLFSFGYFLANLFGVKNKLERLGLGFFIAFGLVGFSLFGITALNIPLNINIVYVLIGLSFVSLVFSIKEISEIRISGWWWVIVTLVSLSLIINLYQPPITWDSLTLYDFRARLFADGLIYRDLYLNLFKYGGDFGYYTHGYPPLISLVVSLSYLINEPVMPLFSGTLLAFILVFYSLLKKYSTKKIGVIFSLILASTSIFFYHSTIFYSNLFYSTLLSLSALYLFDYLKNMKVRSLLFCFLLLIISSWVRMTEPFYMLIFLLSIIVTIFQKRIPRIVLCFVLIIVTLLTRSSWQSYVNSINSINFNEVIAHTSSVNTISKTLSSPLNYVVGIVDTLSSFDLTKVGEIFNYVTRATDIYFYLIVSFILLAVSKIRRSISNLMFWFITLSYLMMIFGVAYFSLTFPDWNQITDSARRMMMFTIPGMLFFIGTMLNIEDYPKK